METIPQSAFAGLTGDDAAARLLADGPNELPTAKPRNFLQQVWQVVRQPMLLLLLVAGTVNFALAEPFDGVALFVCVLIVIGIAIYQERKTEHALAALRDLSSPRALVIRDGQEIRVPGREVVRGDLVLVVEGDRIPADGVLLHGASVSVDESALTGESVPVRKATGADDGSEDVGVPGGDATPWLFSGTLVVKGQGLVRIRRTGRATELGRIGTALRTIEPERTGLQREIDRLVKVIAVIGLGAAVVVVVVYGLTRSNWLEGSLAGIATAMALLPEEFPVVLTVFLAVGAWRMSQHHVLTRRPPVIETLGSATVIGVDKTGTLTMNRMDVVTLVVDGTTYVVDDQPLRAELLDLAEVAVLASPVSPFDPMDKAFRVLGDRLGGAGRLHPDWVLAREYPLSENLLAWTFAWRPAGSASPVVVATKGAPEAVALLCRLDAAGRARLTAQVEAATADGLRVLAVARATHAGPELPDDPRDYEFELLGLVGLQDPLRPGVPAAVAECSRAGIRTIMITGDYPGTALAVARQAGLDHAGGVVTGPELAEMSDDDLARRAREVNVFARMVPEQKLRLVRALQADGEVVGMTGDGVNDAPALRAADIGMAMGRRGTDVARESAALVITDDDFASIAAGVRRGRGIYDNLRKAMSYILAVHVPIIGMSLVPLLVNDWPLVLLPVQIAFLELIIDPACSVVFEAEEVDPEIMDRPPRAPGAPIFGRRTLTIAALQGGAVLAAVLGVYLWGVLSERPDDVVRSVTFATVVVGNLALILVNRSWHLSIWQTFRQRRNRTLTWVAGGAAGTLVLVMSVPTVRKAFDLGPMAATDWVVAVLAGFAGVVWFEVFKATGAARPRDASARWPRPRIET